MCLYQQIGCFMGFSITGCVYSGTMFICYSITLAYYAERKTYCDNYKTYSRRDYKDYRYDNYKYYDCYGSYSLRATAAENLAGLGSCLLILSLVELVVAIASSIYCCKAVCCNSARVGNTVSNYHQQFSC